LTKDRSWTQDYKTVGYGVVSTHPAKSAQAKKPTTISRLTSASDIIGNSKSHAYYLPEGCPIHDKVSSRNQITFESESAAKLAGYGKAGSFK